MTPRLAAFAHLIRAEQWQAHGESRAFSDLAGGFDLPAVRIHDPFDDRKAEAEASRGFVGGRAGVTEETLEEVRQILRRNAAPGVRDSEHGFLPLGLEAERDVAAVAGVLDSVVE